MTEHTGKATLQRLESTPAIDAEADRYHKISHEPERIRQFFIEHFLRHYNRGKSTKQIIIDLDATDDPLVQDLPVMQDCGESIARYLKAGRPSTDSRRLFVRHAVPTGSAMNAENVRGAMRRAYARAGFSSEVIGTHILRHTAATNMLNNGSTRAVTTIARLGAVTAGVAALAVAADQRAGPERFEARQLPHEPFALLVQGIRGLGPGTPPH